MAPFDPEHGRRARAAARLATGIEIEEDGAFVSALDAFYHFARLKAPSEAGFAQLDALAHRLLINRLRFADDLARHPEILDEDVSDPIVVMGFPRSGTTVLQRMISADPAMQSLKLWRLLNPAPFPDEPPGGPAMGRMHAAEEVAEAIRTHNPILHAAHPAVSDDADEDWYLHHLTFQHIGHIFTGLPDPDYLAYLRSLPRLSTYRYAANLLRYLQWQEGGRRHRRWVMKSPVHVGNIEELLAVHPRATFVYPRRDFQTVVASFCYTLEASLQPALAVAPEQIGRITLDFWGTEMRRFQEVCRQLLHSFLVETHECIAAHRLPEISDDAVREVPAIGEQGKSGFDRHLVYDDIMTAYQRLNGATDIRASEAIDTPQHPDELTQRGQWYRNQVRFGHCMLSGGSLRRIVCDTCANENIRIDSDPHNWPAQPLAMTSFISSMETTRCPSRLSIPKKAEMSPFGRFARILSSPFGSLRISSCPPSGIPRCCNRSFLRVIWPLDVVFVPMGGVGEFMDCLRLHPKKVREVSLLSKLSDRQNKRPSKTLVRLLSGVTGRRIAQRPVPPLHAQRFKPFRAP
jgi:hypothetical protein